MFIKLVMDSVYNWQCSVCWGIFAIDHLLVLTDHDKPIRPRGLVWRAPVCLTEMTGVLCASCGMCDGDKSSGRLGRS